MKKLTLWLLISAGVASAAGGVAFFALRPGMSVDSARVERGQLEVKVTEEGRMRVQERYVVAAPVNGMLMRSAVDAGDTVAQGAVLFQIYPAPESARQNSVGRAETGAASARRREAAAKMDEVEGRLAQLQRDEERTRVLVNSGALARNSLEQAQLATTTAQKQRDAAKATLRAAEADLSAASAAVVGLDPVKSGSASVQVVAPSAGRVLRVLQESARVVQAGTPLVAIGDPGHLEVLIDVRSEDAVRVAVGQSVSIDEWGGDGSLRGKVRLVEPEAFTKVSALGVEEQRVHVVASVDDAPPTLGSGYKVVASIITWAADSVLRVPTNALFRRAGKWHTFVVEGGTARLRPVQIGHRSSERAEVVGGLSAGAEVIVFPSDQLHDGLRVAPQPD